MTWRPEFLITNDSGGRRRRGRAGRPGQWSLLVGAGAVLLSSALLTVAAGVFQLLLRVRPYGPLGTFCAGGEVASPGLEDFSLKTLFASARASDLTFCAGGEVASPGLEDFSLKTVFASARATSNARRPVLPGWMLAEQVKL